MFCDLVGSTALSRQLDPEDLREVMLRYQDAVSAAVTRYGGHVAKYLGDGVLAYFGWPQAHEDQAERAVQAGLEAVRAVKNVRVAQKRPLAARVGIATGQVVVGDLVGESGRDVGAVSGETPNLAARLQSLAGGGAGRHRRAGLHNLWEALSNWTISGATTSRASRKLVAAWRGYRRAHCREPVCLEP